VPAVTTPAAIALAVAAVFAIGDWVSRARDDRRLEYVCKPATLAALIATALLLDPELDAQRAWFVAALVCSLAGDVLLMLPDDRFVAGLAAFLAAHLCYLGGLWLRDPTWTALAVSALVVVAAVIPVALVVIRGARAEAGAALARPVAAYVVVISTMLVVALATRNVLAGAGAALFVASDSMIAWNRFVHAFTAASVAIMVTYHLGQAGLVLSLVT
jgi:uncharacterized membrane protein YhhN